MKPYLWVSGGQRKRQLTRKQLEQMWSALHDLAPPFCARPPFDDGQMEKVRGWLCGTSSHARGARDGHMDDWERLIRAVLRYKH